jgi:hypothetical protein
VDEVAVGVDQDVGVVAVAHLEQVRDEAAARQATSEEGGEVRERGGREVCVCVCVCVCYL